LGKLLGTDYPEAALRGLLECSPTEIPVEVFPPARQAFEHGVGWAYVFNDQPPTGESSGGLEDLA
jgi:hypothetical protein